MPQRGTARGQDSVSRHTSANAAGLAATAALWHHRPMPARLPIDDCLPDLISALEQGRCAVLAAPPGAGKTTRVPLALLGQPWLVGRLLMLEPRRLATRAAAEYLAAHLGEKPGQRIGYRIRGETRVSKATRIEVITEGILTRMLQSDPALTGIGCVLFDEVHERSIHSDLGLALCLEAQDALRPDLRLVAMSATLDTQAFASLMGNAPVIQSEGRSFPVETRWLARPWRKPQEKRHHVARPATELIQRALGETEGDILVFLPGAGEINLVAGMLADATADFAIRPLYGALSFERQRAGLREEPDGRRRIVLATSIAETSLTVPGIRVVVDAGLARRARVDAGTGLSRLVTEPVSRAEADQRRGRAGRLGPGVCYRMWTKGEEGGLPAHAPPEIVEADLAGLALELAAWGTSDPASLAFPTPPPAPRFAAARALLAQIGALDGEGRITDHGRAMAAEPVHPRLAHLLLSAKGREERATAAWLAALLTEADPAPEAGSDLSERLRRLAAGRVDNRRAKAVHDTARRLAPKGASDARMTRPEQTGALLALAYPDRIALARPDTPARYLMSSGRGARLDPGDALAGQRLLVAADLSDGSEALIRRAATLSETELRAALGSQVRTVSGVTWSSRQRQILARKREMLGEIALSERNWAGAPAELFAEAMIEGIRDLGLACLPWSRSADALRARVAWVRNGGGPKTETLPDWSDAALLGGLSAWLGPHLTGLRRIEDLASLDLTTVLRTQLDWDTQQALDRFAPATYETPLGSAVRIEYSGIQPKIAVRVQEMFGLTQHPMIGSPPQPLLLELLSPAQRPVQATTDLPGFWAGSYADVRKDMRARYPKHPWPENPAEASPTRRAKPRG